MELSMPTICQRGCVSRQRAAHESADAGDENFHFKTLLQGQRKIDCNPLNSEW
jgi:hypothetical protein